MALGNLTCTRIWQLPFWVEWAIVRLAHPSEIYRMGHRDKMSNLLYDRWEMELEVPSFCMVFQEPSVFPSRAK